MKLSRLTLALAALFTMTTAMTVYSAPMGKPGGGLRAYNRPGKPSESLENAEESGTNAGYARYRSKERRFGDPRMDMHLGMELFIAADPDSRKVLEAHRTQVEKIMAANRDTKNDMNSRRKDLVERIDALALKYSEDPSVSGELLQAMKDLSVLQTRIQQMNQRSMDRMRELNLKLERDLQNSRNAWLRRLEKDPQELARFTEALKKRRDERPLPPMEGRPMKRRPQR